MRSHSSLTSTSTSPKFLPLALSALITFSPLIYLANHSFKLDRKNPLQQVVEMSLLEDLIKPIPLPKQGQQQVIPNTVLLPSPVIEPLQNTETKSSITPPFLLPEVVEPKALNLNVPFKARDSIIKSNPSAIKQLIEDGSVKAANKQTEKFANDVKNSAKPDCLKNDYGLGLFNVLPLIYDIAKDRCH